MKYRQISIQKKKCSVCKVANCTAPLEKINTTNKLVHCINAGEIVVIEIFTQLQRDEKYQYEGQPEKFQQIRMYKIRCREITRYIESKKIRLGAQNRTRGGENNRKSEELTTNGPGKIGREASLGGYLRTVDGGRCGRVRRQYDGCWRSCGSRTVHKRPMCPDMPSTRR